jgi:hypothetical protein
MYHSFTRHRKLVLHSLTCLSCYRHQLALSRVRTWGKELTNEKAGNMSRGTSCCATAIMDNLFDNLSFVKYICEYYINISTENITVWIVHLYDISTTCFASKNTFIFI